MKTLTDFRKKLISMALVCAMVCTLFSFVTMSVGAAPGDNFKIATMTVTGGTQTKLTVPDAENGFWDLEITALGDNIGTSSSLQLDLSGTQEGSPSSVTEAATIEDVRVVSKTGNNVVDAVASTPSSILLQVKAPESNGTDVLVIETTSSATKTSLAVVKITVKPDPKIKKINDLANELGTNIILNHNDKFEDNANGEIQEAINKQLKEKIVSFASADANNKANVANDGKISNSKDSGVYDDLYVIPVTASTTTLDKDSQSVKITVADDPVATATSVKKEITFSLVFLSADDATGAIGEAKDFVSKKTSGKVTLPYTNKYMTDKTDDEANNIRASLIAKEVQKILMTDKDLMTKVFVNDITASPTSVASAVRNAKAGTFNIYLNDTTTAVPVVIKVEYEKPTEAEKLAEDKLLIEYAKPNPDLSSPTSLEAKKKYRLLASAKTDEEKQNAIKTEITNRLKDGNGTTAVVELVQGTSALFTVNLKNGTETGFAVINVDHQILFERIEMIYASTHPTIYLQEEKVEDRLGIGDVITPKIILSDGRELPPASASNITVTWTAEGVDVDSNTANGTTYTVKKEDVDKDIRVSVAITAASGTTLSPDGVTPASRSWKTSFKVSRITEVQIIDAETELPFSHAPYIGQKLKAVVKTNATIDEDKIYSNSGDPTNYAWTSGANTANGAGAATNEYTVVAADIGNKLKVTVTSDDVPAPATGTDRTLASKETLDVKLYDRIDIVDVNGNAASLLEGSDVEARIYYPGNDEPVSTGWEYSWRLGSASATGDDIISTNSSASLDDEHIGKKLYLVANLTGSANQDHQIVKDLGFILPKEEGAIKTARGINADGDLIVAPKIGEVIDLNIIYLGEDGETEEEIKASEIASTNPLTVVWYSVLNDVRVPLDANANNTYTITPSDSGKNIVAVVIGSGDIKGTVTWTSRMAARGTTEEDTVSTSIDLYSGKEIIVVPASIENYSENQLLTATSYGVNINLTTEVFDAGTFEVMAYSIDGGAKWKAGAVPSSVSKLLNKDMTLYISNKSPSKNTTTGVLDEAIILKFPTIGARPKPDKLAVNYAIGAQKNSWVLSADGETPVKEGIEIAEVQGKSKVYEYGRFYGTDESDNGIKVEDMGTKTNYVWRIAAVQNDNGTYTAASKEKKISVVGLQKAPNYKVKNNTISVKAGTSYKIGDGNVITLDSKGVVGGSGSVQLWMAATAKKPASIRQILTLQ